MRRVEFFSLASSTSNQCLPKNIRPLFYFTSRPGTSGRSRPRGCCLRFGKPSPPLARGVERRRAIAIAREKVVEKRAAWATSTTATSTMKRQRSRRCKRSLLVLRVVCSTARVIWSTTTEPASRPFCSQKRSTREKRGKREKRKKKSERHFFSFFFSLSRPLPFSSLSLYHHHHRHLSLSTLSHNSNHHAETKNTHIEYARERRSEEKKKRKRQSEREKGGSEKTFPLFFSPSQRRELERPRRLSAPPLSSVSVIVPVVSSSKPPSFRARVPSGLDRQLLQVIHEDGQRDVVGQDDLGAGAGRGASSKAAASCAKAAAARAEAARGGPRGPARRVGGRRVELGQQEPRLRPVLVAVDQPRDGKALAGEDLCIPARSRE